MDQRNVGELTEDELRSLGDMPREYVPEQERNFDAGTIPTRNHFRVKGTCEHKGVTYNLSLIHI